MSEPKWCQWCGAAQSGTDGDDILFKCGSWHSGSTPEYQWVQCKLNVAEQRIQLAADLLNRLQQLTAPDADLEYSILRGKLDIDEVRTISEGLQVAIEALKGGSSEHD